MRLGPFSISTRPTPLPLKRRKRLLVEIVPNKWNGSLPGPRSQGDGILNPCGVLCIAYGPLGRGELRAPKLLEERYLNAGAILFLTGAYKSPEVFAESGFCRSNTRFEGRIFKENLELVGALK